MEEITLQADRKSRQKLCKFHDDRARDRFPPVKKRKTVAFSWQSTEISLYKRPERRHYEDTF